MQSDMARTRNFSARGANNTNENNVANTATNNKHSPNGRNGNINGTNANNNISNNGSNNTNNKNWSKKYKKKQKNKNNFGNTSTQEGEESEFSDKDLSLTESQENQLLRMSLSPIPSLPHTPHDCPSPTPSAHDEEASKISYSELLTTINNLKKEIESLKQISIENDLKEEIKLLKNEFQEFKLITSQKEKEKEKEITELKIKISILEKDENESVNSSSQISQLSEIRTSIKGIEDMQEILQQEAVKNVYVLSGSDIPLGNENENCEQTVINTVERKLKIRIKPGEITEVFRLGKKTGNNRQALYQIQN